MDKKYNIVLPWSAKISSEEIYHPEYSLQKNKNYTVTNF